jgi:hypothetical protein
MKRTARGLGLALLLLILAALVVVGFSCAKTAYLSSGGARAPAAAPPPPSPPSAPGAAPAGGPAPSRLALESKSAADQAVPSPGMAGGGASAKPAENQLDPFKVRAQQMIIYTADFSIKVDKAAEAADKLRALAEKNAGWVSALNKTVDDSGNTRVNMQVRVPSGKFMDVVSGLEGMGKVDSENLKTENVSEEWVDLNARLGVKQLRKQQLEALLKRAQSTEEIDRRQQEINAVQEEIERIQGRQHFLQNQVALSTLNVTFYEKGLPPIEKPGPYSAKDIVVRAWYELLDILRVLFVLLVYVALPGAVVWVPVTIWILWRRAHPKPKRTFPPAPPAAPSA